MNLLEVVVDHLGDVDLWPSLILTYLFNDHPSPVLTDRLRTVIAFFYGNDIPVDLAYRFYSVCNGRASRFVGERFRELYHVWRTRRCEPHMATYWNMRLEKFVYINGSLLNQSEPVSSEVSEMRFGIDNTLFPRKIRDRLKLARRVVM